MKYSTRNSHYLRISPHAVLLLELYLDPIHLAWMSDHILERILLALRDRIPAKLRQEGHQSKAAQRKAHVDVYRGTNYQIAFYFRKTTQRHAVLLKDIQLVFQSHQQLTPAAKRARSQTESKRARSDEGDSLGEPSQKRGKRGGVEEIVIKDEEVEQAVPSYQGPEAPLFRPEEEDGYAEELKADRLTVDDFDTSLKPEVKVNYTGYSIFGMTLVVIVEPYPALHPSQHAVRPSVGPVEVRQLSSSVQPEASGSRSRSHTAARSVAPPEVTVFERSGSRLVGRQEPLFRSTTTPLEELPPPPSPRSKGKGKADNGGETDESLRAFRESSQALVNGWMPGEDQEEEEAETLPSVQRMFGQS